MNLKKLLQARRKKRRLPVPEIVIKNSPIEIAYQCRKKYVTSIEVSRCRTNIMGLNLPESPFVAFLKDYGAGGVRSYRGSLLENFYNEIQPKSMCEVLGLNDNSFKDVHPMATVKPWWDLSPQDCLRKRVVDLNAKQLYGRESFEHGLKVKGNFGWQHFGPVSDGVGELEFRRLVSVYNSVKEKGYLSRGSVPIHGEFLITDNDWSWTVSGGKHRLSTLVALGWQKIPVTTKSRNGASFIRAAEVDSWPNVRNGLFTREQALKVFSHISGLEL